MMYCQISSGTITKNPETTITLGKDGLDYNRQTRFENDNVNIVDKPTPCVLPSNYLQSTNEVHEVAMQYLAKNHQLPNNPECLPRHNGPYSRDVESSNLTYESCIVDERCIDVNDECCIDADVNEIEKVKTCNDNFSQLSYLKCVSLNVSGLQSKLRLGILDHYLEKFDIIGLTETNTDSPELSNTRLSNFTCYPKKMSNPSSKYKYGGIHGICILVNPVYADSFQIVTDIESECTLWGKLKVNDDLHFIIGAVYIPCDNSRFHFDDAISQIEKDIIELKCRYNLPICLLGDFNAHTKQADDIVDFNDMAAEITGCDYLYESESLSCNDLNANFTNHRYSQDTSEVNKNGQNLLSLCQSLDFRIVNGRVGADKYRGNPTCHKNGASSVIDYAIANEQMIPYINDFCVELFDPCLSDVHSAITCTISNNTPSLPCHNVYGTRPFLEDPTIENEENDSVGFQKFIFRWTPETATAYEYEISNIEPEFEVLCNHLHDLNKNVSQSGINELCEKLNNTMIDVAKKVGAYKVPRTSTSHTKPRRTSPPWFDHECAKKRKDYYKVKNTLKRKGEKSMSYRSAKEYKKFLKTKEKQYYKQLNNKIRSLRSSNCKDYWSLLKTSTEGQKTYSKLCLQTFMEHFRKLSQDGQNDCNSPSDKHPQNNGEFTAEINTDFTVAEIFVSISRLKNNKACGSDHIRNEFLKKAPPMLIEFICNFFNLILSTGFVPDCWCHGFIMPLYKAKGSREDPNNYRGITLLSCLGKLFTACINSRISQFMYDDVKIGYEQAGFRPEFSTIDHIFTLHTIIEYYKSKKGRVYCAFIDYSKAFDLVDRASLWLKLLSSGVNGRIFDVIYNMYSKAKSCVKNDDKISSFFSCNIGVRQGENLSPILFAIYLKDFQHFMSDHFKGLEKLSSETQQELETFLKLYVLLYADDTIIMAESDQELQLALSGLNDYCKKWSLQINVSKTKIVIFSRGKVRKYPKFTIGNEEVQVCDDYVYLGVTFNFNGSFRKAISKQISQARKAMFSLLEKAKILRLPVDIVCDLFDKCVVPVLLYGSEVWGCESLRDIEIFHRNFLRMVLRTFKFTPNCMLYGETGSTDMKSKIHKRMINFWAKLKFGTTDKFSSLMCQLLSKLQSDNSDNPEFKWIWSVQNILNGAGFSYIWNAESLDLFTFKENFSQRCNDIFLQNWQEDMQQNSQCSTYKLFKHYHEMEDYLVELADVHKFSIAKFRTRTHHLPITRSRFKDYTVDVTCPLCPSGDIGDECHYLFRCKFFEKQREKFLPTNVLTHQPDAISLSSLFQSHNLINTACFVKNIMSKFKYTGNQKKSKKQKSLKPSSWQGVKI